MKVVLTKTLDTLGKRGEIKVVKDGYFRNYLLPNGIAMVATRKRIKWAETEMGKMVKAKEELAKEAGKFKEQLEALTIIFEEKTTDKDTLYGSIGEKEIMAALEAQGKVKVEKKAIHLPEHIKSIGVHKVNVTLAEGVDAVVKIEVKAKS